MKELTPKEIVAELDKYIIGQDKAKRAVAVALRNRYRRQRLPEHLRDEVAPKNILMIGPTGVGKTEIARRIARLINAPFVKVEATKYTERGYVGGDVDQMVRDLFEMSFQMVKQEKLLTVQEQAMEMANMRLVELLKLAPALRRRKKVSLPFPFAATEEEEEEASSSYQIQKEQAERLRRHYYERVRSGEYDNESVDVEIEDSRIPIHVELITPQGVEQMGFDPKDLLGIPKNKKKRRMKVAEARQYLTQEEAEKLLDHEQIVREAKKRAEESGIIFIDELDKVAGRERGYGPEVSREGVQRDLLPIVEGTSVSTRFGPVNTHHVLFFGAGAFHISKPSDLIPELQGRFPIRVELDALTEQDFRRILVEPENALVKQYKALLETEDVKVEITEDAIAAIAQYAQRVNEQTENIGARRLHTIMEKVLEDFSFRAPELSGQTILVDAKYVKKQLEGIVKDQDLSRYIL